MDAPGTTRVRYALDKRASRFTVRVSAVGMLAAFGHSPTIAVQPASAALSFEPTTMADAAVTFRIPVDQLTVQDDINEQDKREIERTMRAVILESARFPEIVFESTQVTATPTGAGAFALVLVGQLSIHGETRGITVAARVVQTGEIVRTFGDFTLRQSDFGIKPYAAVGGTLKVKDELTCTFDLAARRVA